MESKTNDSGALYRDAAIEQTPMPRPGPNIELLVVPPPQLQTTDDLVRWLDTDLREWLLAIEVLVRPIAPLVCREDECAALAQMVAYDLGLLVEQFIVTLRTGRLESIGTNGAETAEDRQRLQRSLEDILDCPSVDREEGARVANWLLKAARGRAEAYERETAEIAAAQEVA